MKVRPIVLIEWHDAWANERWREERDVLADGAPVRCVSVGMELKRDAESVVLYGAYSPESATGLMGNVQIIPASAVVRRVVLKKLKATS